ncbi:MAG: glycosyltransferase family 2 protein [Bryobacterales bacterium]|nr:glycosyltransferase family 2 protein [Bryobacterales bacterium]
MSVVASVAFVLSAGFVVYVLLVYPLLVAALARWRPKPVRRAPIQPRVSVILAVRDGERWLERKLDSILALDYPKELMEIFVVSDGSADATDEIAARYAPSGVRLIRIPRQGKWAAINAGIAAATGEILFFTDVRQTLEPGCLTRLVAPFADPSVGVVSGGLVIRHGGTRQEAATGLYWSYEKWIRIRQSAVDSVLGATGAIYAMRRELAEPLPPDTLLDDVHLPMGAFVRGFRVLIDESAQAFDEPSSLRSEFRRKVRTLAGNYQVLRAFPVLLTPANRMWLHFLSHKFGRLLLPFALILCAVSAFFLPPGWREALLAGQFAFYTIAAADLAVPESSGLKRLTAPVQTFVALMAATLCASRMLLPFNRRFRW